MAALWRSISYEELTSSPKVRTEPCLVTGIEVLEELWTPDTMVAQVSDVEVPIVHISGGDYVGGVRRQRSVGDYFNEISREVPSDPIPYLAELSYDEHFPGLAAQLVAPPNIPGETFIQRVMYFGRGVHSQIHFHTGGSAMLFCIHGTKVVRLFAPDQSANLYKVRARNFSRVLVSSVGENSYDYDVEEYPDFADAEYVEYEVSAGEALYIPIHWWHSIQNLEDISLTAVYFWNQSWKDTWRDFAPPELPPRGMRLDYGRNLAYRYVVNPIKSLRKR